MNLVKQIKLIANDTAFLDKTIKITIPIALQGFLNTTLNFLDTLMIGSLGESSIAAVGLANKFFFVFSLLIFGIVSGSGVLTAQYWGKRDVKNIRKVLGLSLLLVLGGSLFFFLPAIFTPGFIMRIFTNSENTIKIGAIYLSIVALSYPFTAVTNAYISLLRGVNEVKVPVIISTIAILVNVVFNYILIFGKFGFPVLGVAGAAIATVLARFVECTSLIFMVYRAKGPAAARLRELIGFESSFVKKFFKTTLPVIANEFMWGLGVTMYSLVYGRMGDAAVAAITITQTVEQIVMVAFMSLSNGTAVILGNEMGAGHLKDAENHAKNLIIIETTLAFIIGFLALFIRQPIINLFNVTNTVSEYINICLLVFIIYIPFKMFNYLNVVGILRSGGDTKASLFLDCTGVWLIGIPMAYLGGMILNLPIYFVYAMVLSEEVYKFVLGIIRYRQKKWLRNIVATD